MEPTFFCITGLVVSLSGLPRHPNYKESMSAPLPLVSLAVLSTLIATSLISDEFALSRLVLHSLPLLAASTFFTATQSGRRSVGGFDSAATRAIALALAVAPACASISTNGCECTSLCSNGSSGWVNSSFETLSNALESHHLSEFGSVSALRLPTMNFPLLAASTIYAASSIRRWAGGSESSQTTTCRVLLAASLIDRANAASISVSVGQSSVYLSESLSYSWSSSGCTMPLKIELWPDGNWFTYSAVATTSSASGSSSFVVSAVQNIWDQLIGTEPKFGCVNQMNPLEQPGHCTFTPSLLSPPFITNPISN